MSSNLRNLKSKVDKLVIGKLETTTFDVSKLSDVVKNKLLKSLNIMNYLKRLIILILLRLLI